MYIDILRKHLEIKKNEMAIKHAVITLPYDLY